MTLAQIKEIRDTYKAVPGIVIDIYLDNDITFHQGLKEEIILWDDSKQRITSIRNNNRINQHLYPYEVVVSSYEHIQSMYVAVDLDGVKKYLKTINYDKNNQLLEYLSTLPVNSTIITVSTSDLIDWNKPNTLEEQNDYSKIHSEQISEEMKKD